EPASRPQSRLGKPRRGAGLPSVLRLAARQPLGTREVTPSESSTRATATRPRPLTEILSADSGPGTGTLISLRIDARGLAASARNSISVRAWRGRQAPAGPPH